MKLFSELNLSPALQQQIAAANFITPTPVQAGAIPPAMEGRDVIATAQTGTGKTLSFLIPLVERMPKAAKGATALVLLPTRELAMQVLEHYRHLTQSKGTAALVCGGLAEGPQLEAIRRGARLIVATPGRLEDYLDRRLVNLSGIKILVLDEVDRMLDMGFKPAIRRIAAALPADRQTLCYSATLSPEIRDVARDYLRNPVRVEIGSVLKPSPNVELQSFEVPTDKKQELLEHLLGSRQTAASSSSCAPSMAPIASPVDSSAPAIPPRRFTATARQSQRNAALASFANGRHRILVATDVAARGIDVADVAHVVNFDMPKEAEDFVHRVGRTGRASARGVASTFAAPDETHALRKMERTLAITTKKFRVRPRTARASA